MTPGIHRFHLTAGGHRRRWLAYVPQTYNGTSLLPVVMMLHGAGATARWTMLETGLPEFADAAGFLAVFPEGLPPHPDRPTSLLDNPPGWNDGLRTWARHDDLDFIGQLLAELPRQFSIDPRRVYVTGFSNGASFSFLVAERFSTEIAALAPVAGHCLFKPARLSHPMPTFYLIGTADPLLPLEGGEVVMPWGHTIVQFPVRETWHRWATALGLPPQEHLVSRDGPITKYRLGPGAGGVVMDCWTIAGHGHHWPGGRGSSDVLFTGPSAATIDANQVIWDYCKHRTLD